MKIVITGMGIKVPGGDGLEDFRNSLIHNKTGLSVVADVNPKGGNLILGRVQADTVIDGINYKRYPKISIIAIEAAKEAISMSGLDNNLTSNRTGVWMGTALAGIEPLEEIVKQAYVERNYKGVPLHGCGLAHGHSLASGISAHWGLESITRTLNCGCASSIECIEDAINAIRAGSIDVAVVGGADVPNAISTIYGFGRIRMLSLTGEYTSSGVPFSEISAGFVSSEGASCLIIESEQHALSRGANILGTISSVYSNNDAAGINSASADGKPMLELLRRIKQDGEISFSSSLAMGIKSGDRLEISNHVKTFGENAPLLSIKAITGHTFGASGTMQLIAGVISMQDNKLYGVIGSGDRVSDIDSFLVTSHGYGGNNAVVRITR